jgi:hypothetical protein
VTFSVLVQRVGVSDMALVRFLKLLLISYVAVAVVAAFCVIGAAYTLICFWGIAEKLLTGWLGSL